MNIELFTAFLLITIVLDHHARSDRHPRHFDRGHPRFAGCADDRRRARRSATRCCSRRSASGSTGCTRMPTCCSKPCAGPARPISFGSACRLGGMRERAARSCMETGRTRFVRGLVVALSNPKTIVFFTAFLPQFLDPRLPAGPQLAAMCVVVGVACRRVGLRLGGRVGPRTRMVHEACAGEIARSTFGRRFDRRRILALLGQTAELTA